MDVLYRSAFELASEIKSGRLSSSKVLAFFLERVEHLNPQLNAVVALDTDRARTRAEAADLAAANGEDWGALHGVPITIKDAFCTQGLVTTAVFPSAGIIPRLPGVRRPAAAALQLPCDVFVYGLVIVPDSYLVVVGEQQFP